VFLICLSFLALYFILYFIIVSIYCCRLAYSINSYELPSKANDIILCIAYCTKIVFCFFYRYSYDSIELLPFIFNSGMSVTFLKIDYCVSNISLM